MKQINLLQPPLDCWRRRQAVRLIVKTKQTKKNKSPWCGYGECQYCYCQSYQGNDYTCANCGHNYYSHW
jgi:hypothetical protein